MAPNSNSVSFVLLLSLMSLKPSDGQGIKISGTFLSDQDQARVTATGNSCRQGFPCGKYGQHYYWCWTSYRNGGDWDYCCAPEMTCAKHGLNYDWCWADSNKNKWSYCKAPKATAKTAEPTKPPTTTSTTTTTTTTTRRRTTTTRPPTTRRTYTKSVNGKKLVKRDSEDYYTPTTRTTARGELKDQILNNVQSAVQEAVATSQRDIQKMDLRMQRLQRNMQQQEERMRKIDKVEQTQEDINSTLAQITKWIRYLSTSVEGLNSMKKKVDLLAKQNELQKTSGDNAQWKYALKNNELDNNSISKNPNFFYQKKVPSALKSSPNSSERTTRALSDALCLSLLGLLSFALFDAVTAREIGPFSALWPKFY